MQDLIKQTKEFLKDYPSKLSLLANMSALIKEYLPDTNWVGFYLFKKDKLILGPFQGKVACLEIPLTKGVCGSSYASNLLLNVKDVHKFPGHIACDSRSNSELVIPMKGIGVLDIDSESFNRFTSIEEDVLSEVCKLLQEEMMKK